LSVALLFIVAVGAGIAWWLAGQGLATKPWLEDGIVGVAAEPVPAQRAKVGLLVFLGVAGALFALFISAYLMRMGMADWWALPVPRILWVNTGLLVAASLALHLAQRAAGRGQPDGVKGGLAAGGVATLAFLAGQVLAWRELAQAGHGLTGNPAASFFYLISAVHGLHVAGGLVALGRSTVLAWRGAAPAALRSSVGLCAAYWHFLLVVWVILFGLLAGWANDFAEICRGLVS
jgi:cytochrome c oxidase subunit 3